MIIFDPHPPYLHSCIIDQAGKKTEHRMLVGNGWKKSVQSCLEDRSRADGIGYVLHQGGEIVVQPSSRVSEKTLALLHESRMALPEHNEYTYRVCEYLYHAYPKLPHLVLCETAFFSRLPAEARTYAVPEELRDKHVGRYGASGITHEWAWRKLRTVYAASRKCVSVLLGDRSNIAAIEDGKPVETTAGFTPVEGIPSATSCGDIDPMIVFELNAKGMSILEINTLLSKESGFSGMLHAPRGFLDLIAPGVDAQVAEVRDIFQYSLLRHMGAMLSILGGADTILFVTENSEKASAFIRALCAQLSFLEPALRRTPRAKGNWLRFSKANAKTRFLALDFNRWEVLAETTRLAQMEASS
jgi:acetate kinase